MYPYTFAPIVTLSTYLEQLHSRHLVRSLTGSCTACGCLHEQSGLHIVTSKPFLWLKLSRLRILANGFKQIINQEKRLASWLGRPALSPLAFETCRHSPHTCNPPKKITKSQSQAARSCFIPPSGMGATVSQIDS